MVEILFAHREEIFCLNSPTSGGASTKEKSLVIPEKRLQFSFEIDPGSMYLEFIGSRIDIHSYEEVSIRQFASNDFGPDDTIREKLDAYWSMCY